MLLLQAMIDLCIDARMAFSSGIGTYIREIVPLLNEHFRVVLLVDQLDREWCKGFDQILFNSPIYSIQEQLKYPFKVPKCDLFWSPHYNVPLLPIRAKKRIVTIHDACHLVFGSFVEKTYARYVMKNALRADKVITVSYFSKQEIERFFEFGDLTVIPIGVNTKRFHPKEASEAVRQKYQLPEKFVLFVGSRKAHKNLERLKKVKDLVAVGPGIRRVDDEDLPVLYSMAEVFVFPSLYEGFGLPPLEAMSCGCPTAVSKAASIPEVCGDASVYFDPMNVEEIMQAIEKAKKREFVEKGLERVKRFDWKKTAEKHMRLFEEVARA
ncbi:MAG: glycosyltransferase family 4 protein [Parachlamydiales bacterium]|nr:glycosyltransferase family 4 protein [Parachlamydiales bacterium]